MKTLYIVIILSLSSQSVVAQVRWSDKQGWIPLTEAEIADAHTCRIGTFLAVCAGEKRISTGIIIANRLVGVDLYGESYDFPIDLGNSSWSVEAQVSIRQSPESGGPAWERNYYVVSGEQLSHMIAKARRDPEWQPPFGEKK